MAEARELDVARSSRRRARTKPSLPDSCRQIRRAFGRGVRQGYRVEEDAHGDRARPDHVSPIRFAAAVQGSAPPIEFRYDEFTEDTRSQRGSSTRRYDDVRRMRL